MSPPKPGGTSRNGGHPAHPRFFARAEAWTAPVPVPPAASGPSRPRPGAHARFPVKPFPFLAACAAAPLVAALCLAAPAGKSTPFLGKPAAIPGVIEAENFDDGPAGVAFHDVDTIGDPPQGGEARQLGLRYRHHVVGIEATMAVPRFFLVGVIKEGEWLAYTVDVKKAGRYDLEVSVAGWRDGDLAGQFRIEFDGVDKTGLVTAPNTKSWQKCTALTLPGIELKQGVQVMRVTNVRGNEVLNWESFRFVAAKPAEPAKK